MMKKLRRLNYPSIVFGVSAPESLKLLGNLPKKMLANGWDVVVICGRGAPLHDPWDGNVQILEIPMRREISPLRDLWSLSLWLLTLASLKPDVVSVGTPKAGLLGSVASRFWRVEVRVYMLRGLRLETSRGLQRIVLRAAEKVTASCAHRIIAVSKSLATLYVSENLARETKLEVIGRGSSHGVDLERFRPGLEKERATLFKKLQLLENLPVLGFVGRFSQDKGASQLLETAAYLQKRKIKIQFLLVGPIEDSSAVLRDIQKHCEFVTVIGAVKDPAPLYRTMDILLLPTMREGFPNVALEAGASAVPVVTTDATGAVDSVLPGETGFIANKYDTKGFAKAVETLVADRNLRQKFGSSARIWISQNYEETFVESLYEDFYTSALGVQT